MKSRESAPKIKLYCVAQIEPKNLMPFYKIMAQFGPKSLAQTTPKSLAQIEPK
jgi:hypothetical protein